MKFILKRRGAHPLLEKVGPDKYVTNDQPNGLILIETLSILNILRSVKVDGNKVSVTKRRGFNENIQGVELSPCEGYMCATFTADDPVKTLNILIDLKSIEASKITPFESVHTYSHSVDDILKKLNMRVKESAV